MLKLNGFMEFMPLEEVIPSLNIQLGDPLTSAIILDICRSLPLERQEVIDTKNQSWAKEVKLLLGEKKSAEVDWDVFFEPGCQDRPIAEGVEPNPAMARRIHNGLKIPG
jgi:hypothetical protein